MKRMVLIAATLVIVAGAAAPAVCMAETDRSSLAARPERISITLENQPIRSALLEIAKQADLGMVIAESVPETRKVTVILKNVLAGEAIGLIARQAGLTVEPVGEGPTLLIEAKPGAELATVFTNLSEGPLFTVKTASGAYQPCGDAIQPQWEDLPMTLVDLRAENTTLAEAMAALEKQLEQWRIAVDEAVSKDIKVNANVVMMPLREVLRLLLSQAGLTFSVESYGVPAFRQTGTIHIVPPPEIEVTGAAEDGNLALAEYYRSLRRAGLISHEGMLKALANWNLHGRPGATGALGAFEMVLPTPGVAVCGNCGAPMLKDWRFCPKCGRERQQDESVGPAPAP